MPRAMTPEQIKAAREAYEKAARIAEAMNCPKVAAVIRAIPEPE